MKVLVTGSSGFLGSHVVDELISKGHNVTMFDLKKSNWKPSGAIEVLGSILDEDALNNVVKGQDCVIHLAALSDLEEGLDKPLETVRLNIEATVLIMKLCVANNVKRFLYGSTIYVFSEEGGFYRCSKQSSELYVREFSKRYGLDFTILRYGSLYGDRSDLNNGVFKKLHDFLTTNEREIIVYGNSKAVREYIHVKDAATSTVELMNEEFSQDHMILTGNDKYTLSDLYTFFNEISGKDKRITFSLSENSGHYIQTPYRYNPQTGKKYLRTQYIDFGQGLLNMVESLQNEE